jgi:hypothetical protein
MPPLPRAVSQRPPRSPPLKLQARSASDRSSEARCSSSRRASSAAADACGGVQLLLLLLLLPLRLRGLLLMLLLLLPLRMRGLLPSPMITEDE